MMSPTLLLTRPLNEGEAFLAKLGDVDCVLSPVLAIEPVPFEMPAFENAIFTSAHAVRAVGPALKGKTAWCVGPETAQVAQAFGARCEIATGTGLDLLALVQGKKPRDAVYFRGEEISVDLARLGGFLDLITYRQVSRMLNDAAKSLLSSGAPVVAPVFSRRSGLNLISQVEKWSPHVHIIAISPAVAEVFPAGPRISILPNPGADEMVLAVQAALKEKT
ncbi:MAG: uroporphyrinogen-III synthase [Deltaproteobacteria bacterium]